MGSLVVYEDFLHQKGLKLERILNFGFLTLKDKKPFGFKSIVLRALSPTAGG